MTEVREFDQWCEDLHGICGHYEGVARDRQRAVRGLIHSRKFDGLDVAAVAGDVKAIRRDRHGIRRDQAEHIFCIIQTAGQLQVDHNGATSLIGPGDCLLLDSTKEGLLAFTGRGRLLSLHMPRGLFMQSCRGNVQIGRRLACDHPLAPSIRQQIQHFTLGWDASAAVGKANSDLLLGMIQLAFCKPGNFSKELDAQCAERRFALALEVIDRNLASEGLSLRWLAHEIGMSTRQVQRLFEAERTTFAREVRDRRLNLAASNLRRRRPVGKARISEIAYNSGFRDLSNFNRGFKSRFGMTPREYLETMG